MNLEGIPEQRRLAMLERMLLIRRVEERLGDDFRAGRLIAGVHLYIGQEAVGVGICDHLNDRDWIASTHRGHGHFLAKGGSPESLIAEIYAKQTGVCKGMGGTMHVADFSKGIMGANGIVGGGISLIAGAALAASMDQSGAVGVAFFGDGAAAQGVLSEALNLTALWKLPMVMVCENNEWSEFSPAHTVTAGRISERATPYGVASVEVDGNDVEAVWGVAREAIERARSGRGPTLIEAMTYRLCGHVEAESGFLAGAKYRPDEEVARRRERDPLDLYRNALRDTGNLDESKWVEMQRRVAEVVSEAVKAAEAAPDPPLSQIQDYMFHNQMP